MAPEFVDKQRPSPIPRRDVSSLEASLAWKREQPELRRILNNEEPDVNTRSTLRDGSIQPGGLNSGQNPQAGSVQLQAKKEAPLNSKKAIAANKKLLREKESVLTLQKFFKMASPTGTFDAETIELIDAFQKENSIVIDEGERGVFNRATMLALFDELRAEDQYNPLIFLVIDYYLRNTYRSLKPDIVKLEYNGDLNSDGSFLVENEKDFSITIGHPAFAYCQYLMHTIGHEFEHCRQHLERVQKRKKKKPTLPELGVDEFRAEAFNILSVGLPMKRLDDFMDDARRALEEWGQIEWQKIPAGDRIPLERLFGKVRRKVLKVYADFADYGLAEPYTGLKEEYERLGQRGH